MMRRSKSRYFSKIARASSSLAAGAQDRQGALAEQGVQAALARIEKLGDLLLRKMLEAPLRRDSGIDHVGRKDRGFHVPSYG